MKNEITLSNQEVASINKRHISGVDKWFRMLMGCASEIVKIEKGVIYLDIIYSENASRKPEVIAKSWLMAGNKTLLNNARVMVVKEYLSKGRPGHFMKTNDLNSKKKQEQLDFLIEKSKDFGKEKSHVGTREYVVRDLLE